MTFSLTQSGVYVSLLGFLVKILGLNIGTEELTSLVEAVLTIVGLGMAWYGRYRRGDLTALGSRK